MSRRPNGSGSGSAGGRGCRRGAVAAACGAHRRRGLLGGHWSCLPRWGRRIGERHVPETDPTGDGRGGEIDGVGRIDDDRIQLQVLEDPVEQGERALDLDLDVEQLPEREEQARLQRGERDDVADRGRRRIVLDRQVAGEPIHERRRDREDRADDHEEPAPDHRLPHLQRGELAIELAEPIDGRLLLTERLRQQHPRDGQRLLGRGGHLGE